MQDKKIEIYVVGHDALDTPNCDLFIPIQAGAARSLFDLEVAKDSTGDNISKLNPYYAEITPMYWVWKNTSGQDYVGFFHYRRFLNFGEPINPQGHWRDQNFHDFSDETMKRFKWDEESIREACHNADIIVPNLEVVTHPPDWVEKTSVYNHYAAQHVARDFEIAIEAASRQPGYEQITKDVIERDEAIFCHLFIMKRSIFDEYMTWLFTIFAECEKEIDLSDSIYERGAPQSRVYGFLGERLFNLFIAKKKEIDSCRVQHYQRLFSLLKQKPCTNISRVAFLKKTAKNMFGVRRIKHGVELRLAGYKLRAYKPY